MKDFKSESLLGGSGEPLQLHHVAVVVRDLASSIAWYQQYLGFEHQYDFELPGAKVTMLVLGNARLELYEVEGASPILKERQEVGTVLKAEGINHFAFAVDNVDTVIAALASKGVEIAVPPTNVPNGSGDRFAFLYDSERMLVELIQAAK